MAVSLTFYGGIGEIRGNKILLEADDTRIFLDFGTSRDLWSVDEAQRFVRALGRLWEKWPEFA